MLQLSQHIRRHDTLRPGSPGRSTAQAPRIPRWLEGVKVVKLARPAADYESADGLTRMQADVEAVYPLPTASQKSVVWTQTRHPDGACASFASERDDRVARFGALVPVRRIRKGQRARSAQKTR